MFITVFLLKSMVRNQGVLTLFICFGLFEVGSYERSILLTQTMYWFCFESGLTFQSIITVLYLSPDCLKIS